MRVVLLLILTALLPVQALASSRDSTLQITGIPLAQSGMHVLTCGIRTDGTLYAYVDGVPPSTPTQPETIPYVRYRFEGHDHKLMFDQFVPTQSDFTHESVFFGRDTIDSIGKIYCSVAATGYANDIETFNPGNELLACKERHGRAHVDLGLDYNLRSLAFGTDWAAIRFDGYYSNFFDSERAQTIQDARFFMRLDDSPRVDVLLTGDNPVASFMYPNVKGGNHWIDFGAEDSQVMDQPDNFWRMCFTLPNT
jgi:hypothetical protein